MNVLPPSLRTLLFLAASSMASVAAFAQSPAAAAASPAPAAAPAESLIRSADDVSSWLSGGGDLRIRNEYFNNALTLSDTAVNHEQDLFRIRARLWFTAVAAPDFSLNVRLDAEPRIWMKPAFAKQHVGTGREDRYGILDNCNLKLAHAFGLPLTITAGRQDVQFGDPPNWWLVGDGTPVDGSWSLFLDSVRATLDAQRIRTKFDVVVIDQHARPGSWLPIIGRESTYGLVEQNERGLILYASNKSLPDAQVDGYFIYKRDEAVFAYSDSGKIYTAGAKISGTPSPHWKYSAEGAWQWGWKLDPSVRTPVNVGALQRDIQACGCNARLSYLFKDAVDDQVSLSAEFLSGDKPDTTGKDEMFDVLWGRWPRFSELYIYSYPNETSGKIAQINNLIRIGPTWSLAPVKGMTLSFTYNAWFAPESVPTRAMNTALFSENGHFRGHFAQVFLKQQFSKHVSGHLWVEMLEQGNYYARRDLLSFARAEIMFSF